MGFKVYHRQPIYFVYNISWSLRLELILLDTPCYKAINFQEIVLYDNWISLWSEFSGLEWTFKLLPSKHIEANIWYARPLTSTF
jgi:hypothetical protein